MLASKENARKAQVHFNRLAKGIINDDTSFVALFLAAAVTRLPSNAAYKRDQARRLLNRHIKKA